MYIKRIVNQTGDTIVEVLIAVAVASAILGSAYAIVNRTVQAQQQNSERAEAVKVAGSQVELLRAAESVPATGSEFCYSGTTRTDISGHHAACPTGTDNRYRSIIKRDNNTYQVRVEWDGLSQGKNNVTIFYTVFKS